ncbi:MAG: GntR family transcriptional regulator [Pararhodobacter sp.]
MNRMAAPALERAQLSGPDAVVRDILHGLSEGRYVPGQRLAEPDLMARYGVGRSTVREALGRLAAGGVVVQTPHKGAQIRLLSRRAARDVLRVTEYLLGLAARQAAEAVARGADPAPLIEAAAHYTRTDADARSRARARYYRALITLGGNAELARLLPMLQVHLIRGQLRDARPRTAGERSTLIEAVRSARPDEAERAARVPVSRLLDALDALPDSAFAAEP